MDEEERNYCCLTLLLLRVGNPCLCRYFKTKWDAAKRYSVPWTDCAQNGADLRWIFSPLLYEEDKVTSGDTSQWDLSLLVKVLLYSRPPFVAAANPVTLALRRLLRMRNSLDHSPIPRVEASNFQRSWSDGCSALTLFGATPADFDKVKQDVQKPWTELIPMLKHCAGQANQFILAQLDSIKSDLQQLKQKQETIEKNQTELLQKQDKIIKELSSLNLALEKSSDLHSL